MPKEIPPEVQEAINNLGNANGKKKKKPSSEASRAAGIKLVEFARDNKMVITPAGMAYYIESVLMFNCCPCAKERLSCPCPESVNEVKEIGHCKCHLFWRDYDTFLKRKMEAK